MRGDGHRHGDRCGEEERWPTSDPNGVISAGEAHMSAFEVSRKWRVGRIIRQHVLKQLAEMARAARKPHGGEFASRRS